MTAAILSQEKRKGTFWFATFLLSGTCIGGGMLAMPVQTAEAGFFLTTIALFIGWLLMTYTGLCLVEVTLWFKNDAHFPSMAGNLLGSTGRIVASFIYLMMNYLSLVAYTSGAAKLMSTWAHEYLNLAINHEISCVLFVLVFGSVVVLGTHLVGGINSFLTVFMVAAYAILVSIGFSFINLDNLYAYTSLNQGFSILSIILATFSYQMIVPTVCSYLAYDAKQLKSAVILGTTIPFIVYLTWIIVVHGVVPLEGINGLREAFKLAVPATTPLSFYLNHSLLKVLADLFAFFAMTTSFFGLSLALFTFLEDFFRSFRYELSKGSIVFFTFIPTMLLAIAFPQALTKFLDLSGGFGDSILSCSIPVLLLFVGRYYRHLKGEYRVSGNKTGLIFAMACSVFILILECLKLIP